MPTHPFPISGSRSMRVSVNAQLAWTMAVQGTKLLRTTFSLSLHKARTTTMPQVSISSSLWVPCISLYDIFSWIYRPRTLPHLPESTQISTRPSHTYHSTAPLNLPSLQLSSRSQDTRSTQPTSPDLNSHLISTASSTGLLIPRMPETHSLSLLELVVAIWF